VHMFAVLNVVVVDRVRYYVLDEARICTGRNMRRCLRQHGIVRRRLSPLAVLAEDYLPKLVSAFAPI
jgi:hypothetical protein